VLNENNNGCKSNHKKLITWSTNKTMRNLTGYVKIKFEKRIWKN